MSLYNLLHGSNPKASIYRAALNLEPEGSEPIGRFRDLWVGELDGDPVIAVYTRNGGGNRDCWHEHDPKWGDEKCGGEAYAVEIDETVYVTEGEAKEKGYRLLNVHMGGKRLAATGRRTMETRHTCPRPNSAECACPGCVVQYRLRKHPHYITDRDDDFDCTYATVYFRVPEELRELAEIDKGGASGDERWAATLGRLKGGDSELIKRMRPTIEKVVEFLVAPPPGMKEDAP